MPSSQQSGLEKRKAKEEAKAKKHNHNNQPSETTEDTTPSDNTTEVEKQYPFTAILFSVQKPLKGERK